MPWPATGWRRWLAALLLAAPLATATDLGLSSALLDEVARRFGATAVQRLEAWQGLVAELAQAPVAEQLERVNRFFNAVPFQPDTGHWGREDYWATPAELLVTHGGDCEDYAIAKYFSLRALGVPTGQLRLAYVRATRQAEPHMVLTFYDPATSPEPLVLDNLDGRVRPASQRTDLQPVYSFNGDGLWLARRRGQTVRIGNADELDLWRNVRQRMEQVTAVGAGRPRGASE